MPCVYAALDSQLCSIPALLAFDRRNWCEVGLGHLSSLTANRRLMFAGKAGMQFIILRIMWSRSVTTALPPHSHILPFKMSRRCATVKDMVRARVRREVCGKMNVRVLSMCLFWLRRLAISGSAWHPRALWALIRPPTVQLAEVRFPNSASGVTWFKARALRASAYPVYSWAMLQVVSDNLRHSALKVHTMAAQLLGSGLSRVMLQAIECAVEFWLALEWSPQAQWLLEASETGPLQEEVRALQPLQELQISCCCWHARSMSCLRCCGHVRRR